MDLKKLAADHIFSKLENQLAFEDVLGLIEIPKVSDHGDIAFPCFILAKAMKKAPMVIASELAPTLVGGIFENVQAVGPYVNFFFKKSYLANEVVHSVLAEKNHYGDLKLGNNRNITIDWSSPNIAKPFSLGHLRSTVIGNSVALIAEKCDYKAIKVNHLGDWGT